jgi:hypothetical protein
MEEDLVYNPAWFQQEEQSSPFASMVDAALASQQPAQEQAISSPDTQSEMLSMFEEMKDMMSQLEVMKSQQAESQQVAQQEADDDLSDLEDFRAIFGEDDVNTPIDWQARTEHLQGKSIAATHNNPGNLKYTSWMSEYGAVPGKPALDGGRFASFPTPASGLAARERLLKKSYGNYGMEEGLRKYSGKGYGAEIYPEIRNKKFNELTPYEFNELTRRQIQREDRNVYEQLYGKNGQPYTQSTQTYYQKQQPYNQKYEFNPILKNKGVKVNAVSGTLKDWYSSVSPLYGGLTITSGTDSEHSSPKSKHYSGEAFDIRTWDRPGLKLLNDVKTKGTFLRNTKRGPLYNFNGINALIEKDHLHVNY